MLNSRSAGSEIADRAAGLLPPTCTSSHIPPCSPPLPRCDGHWNSFVILAIESERRRHSSAGTTGSYLYCDEQYLGRVLCCLTSHHSPYHTGGTQRSPPSARRVPCLIQ
ncbi:hypothetical protein E2C01_065515 [Portunus trituberculatus]|uniref:Uncharacterized protein n=1 Tax=Portunus trituberculatus TaxID=210409 RepID=A0A5B7HM34_PORTR|nr:hypothetical protein [Portunus trituberculatus]